MGLQHDTYGLPWRGAPPQAVRGGYFSNVLSQGHPLVTFGDSSPQGEPFLLAYGCARVQKRVYYE